MTIVIIDLGKNYQQLLKPLVKNYWETRLSQNGLPEIIYYYKEKPVFLQWRYLGDIFLTK